MLEQAIAELPGAGLISATLALSVFVIRNELRAGIERQSRAILIFLDSKINGNVNNSALNEALKELHK
jgi:hypothetical protein